ncbi:MAG: TrkA family potassium uptake protein [Erysipelotrichaceae bacterium]|nr:TrkA family potassium uptake protein [Erysipelotrichaceae bacterium]
MKNILLIGLGRFGSYTAKKLYELDAQVMAVDTNEEKVNAVLSYVTGAQIGDGRNIEFLRSLGVRDYDTCIVAIGDSFLASLETTSNLKELGAQKIIARATSHSQEKFLLRNGADEVIFPEKQLAVWTAIRCSSDHISNYIDLSDGYAIYEVDVPALWAGKTLREINIRRRFRLNILGLRSNGEMQAALEPDMPLPAEARILVLGREEDIENCFHLRK